MQQELERFFVMSSAFTSKDPVVRGWVGPDAAFEMVQRLISRYKERQQARQQRQSGMVGEVHRSSDDDADDWFRPAVQRAAHQPAR